MYFPAVLLLSLNQRNVVTHMAQFAAEQDFSSCLGILGAVICREAANLSLTHFTSLKKMTVLERNSIKIKDELNKGYAARNLGQNPAGVC